MSFSKEEMNENNRLLNNELKFIVKSAQLAAVLEASSLKPGNVNPLHNFENTRYEHFLAGGLSIGNAIENSVISGYENKINIGECIFQGISDVKNSHTGGNTHLGILMLFVPIASACGMCISGNDLNFRNLQKNVMTILSSSNVDDAVNLCNAIRHADAGGLGTVDDAIADFDLNNENLRDDLIKNNLNFYNLLKLSAPRDRIAEELTTGMNITFEHARMLREIYQKNFATQKFIPEYSLYSDDKSNNIFNSIIQTYLAILTRFPDTLIARKCGLEKAEEVSEMASKVLENEISIEKFDKYLREKGNKLNPGTTADIVAGSLFIALLNGLEI